VALTHTARLAFVMVAVAAFMTLVASILHLGMVALFLLANDRQVSATAGRNINSTTWGSRSSAHHQARSLVLVTVPIIHPALAVGSAALEGQGTDLHKVFNVHISQMHAQRLTDALGLAARHWGAYNGVFTAIDGADVQSAGSMLVFVMVAVLLEGVHTDGAFAWSPLIQQHLNANVMPARQQIKATMTPVLVRVAVVRITAVAGAVVPKSLAGQA